MLNRLHSKIKYVVIPNEP